MQRSDDAATQRSDDECAALQPSDALDDDGIMRSSSKPQTDDKERWSKSPLAQLRNAGVLGEEGVKWCSLALLVVQNSSMFVVLRYTRSPERKGRMYLTVVVVLIVELVKFALCLALLAFEKPQSMREYFSRLHRGLWVERSETLKLGIPAVCYAVQNNLVFIAVSNLSAAAAQVLYQMKTLSTALFTVTVLGRSFLPAQWASFLLLPVGVALVQSEDGNSTHGSTGASPALGVAAALAAATLSGFAGVYLEKMFTSGGASLWLRNVQLGLFAIPLQVLAIVQSESKAVYKHGLFQGFHASTWLVVAIQAGGALLTAVVIKYAGNVLKTFATVLALLSTCIWSMLLFDFHPTLLFALGVLITVFSILLYSRPHDFQRVMERLRTAIESPTANTAQHLPATV
mmetsp:Transcript_39083/g.78163  ORF Transcript_39083/g.78163 Transcript_39083/m.78163 type:complete len:401 (-) Transcript_39083:40-1242(-)